MHAVVATNIVPYLLRDRRDPRTALVHTAYEDLTDLLALPAVGVDREALLLRRPGVLRISVVSIQLVL